MDCADFDPSNITFRTSTGNVLFPLYKQCNSDIDGYDEPEQILFQTPFITLERSAIYPTNNNKFYLYHYDDSEMSKEMEQVFNLFVKLDEYTQNNMEKIRELEKKINPEATYNKFVMETTINEKKVKFLKFGINYSVGQEINKEYEEKKNKYQQRYQNRNQNQKNQQNIPVIKIYYQSKYSDYYKIHTCNDITKLFWKGKRVRFIIGINKLWHTNLSVGYGAKIMQIQIDSTMNDKLLITRSIQNNSMNMFSQNNKQDSKQDNKQDTKQDTKQDNKQINKSYYGNKYRNNIALNIRRSRIKENTKILKIIAETADTYSFRDKNNFVPLSQLEIEI